MLEPLSGSAANSIGQRVSHAKLDRVSSEATPGQFAGTPRCASPRVTRAMRTSVPGVATGNHWRGEGVYQLMILGAQLSRRSAQSRYRHDPSQRVMMWI
jgi:hypothetical protein